MNVKSDCGNGQVSFGRRKRNVPLSETKTKEVPLQLAIVVRSLEEQEDITGSQSQIIYNNNINDRSPRRLEASGLIYYYFYRQFKLITL